MTDQTKAIIEAIKSIPPGKVTSYGEVGRMAGALGGLSPVGARQVARILHTCSRQYNLPWHRVVSAQKKISLPPGGGREEQAALLLSEGVEVSENGRISGEFFL